MTLAASVLGNHLNYLDHLAPIASLLKIPLILTDQEIYQAAKKFYPNLKIILYEDYVTLNDFLRKNFQGLICCDFHQSQKEKILYMLKKPKITYFWLPHGNSDKGMEEHLFSPLKHEKIVLAYGNKMLDAFRMHGVFHQIPHKIEIGNFRAFYFQKHQHFYQQKIDEIINFPDKTKKTLFYAPSWGDENTIQQILQVLKILNRDLASHFNLLIKPHPYILNRIFYGFSKLQKKQKNIIFIKDFHAIYPLLSQADLYLGDFSSIGYDFLFFNRPMFFLNHKKNRQKKLNTFLFQCGKEIKTTQKIGPIILEHIKQEKFLQKRKKIYHYVFGPTADFKKLKTTLNQLICQKKPEEAL